MIFLDKVFNSLKPKTYEFILNESVGSVQDRLDVFFNRGFWKSVTDTEYNLSGSFTNEAKTEFKIGLAFGSFSTGGSTSLYGTIAALEQNMTKVILKNYSHLSRVAVLVLIVSVALFFLVHAIKQNGFAFITFQTFLAIIFIVGVLFVINRVSSAGGDNMKSQFEKILRG